MNPITSKFNPLNWFHRRSSQNDDGNRSVPNVSSGTKASVRPSALAAALVCGALLAPASSHAGLLAYEGFNYPVGSGNLAGNNGGFGWNGAWQLVVTGNGSVQAGSLVAGANAPTGYDSESVGNSTFAGNGTRQGRFLDTSAGGAFGTKGFINSSGNIGAPGKTLYVSFTQQPNGITSYYEFEFHRANLNDPGRVAGIGNDSGSATGVYLRVPTAAQTAIGAAAGTTTVNFYVVRIDYLVGSNNVSVYRNPTSLTEPASATLSMTNVGDISFNGISFGMFNNSRTVAHDEVRLGETWSDVTTPNATSTGLWDGGGVDNNWSTGGNWDNNVVPIFASPLTFAGSTRLANTNDLTGISANSITFDSAAGAFTINGNNLGLIGNISFNTNPVSPITQTINLPLTPSVDFAVDTQTNGNIAIAGNITGTGRTLTKTSAGNAGVLTLSGTNALAGLIINGGTNRITGSTTITGTGGTLFYLGNGAASFNGTLVIENNANLSIGGSFGDAAVIGRNGGSGTIIQNGGTFNFNPANNQLFLVGAANSTATHAEYDMKGGVFNLNNYKLGVGLGTSGISITGVLNQVSGVISNVVNLDLGTLTPSGRGVYNLTGGSIYIGTNGITTFDNLYTINLGGGTIGAYGNWASTLTMNLTGTNGPVTFNPGGNTITLSGVLAGSGGLNVSGGGTLELSGANTYSGDTTVNAGSTLQLDVTGSSAGAFRVANGGVLNLNYSGNYAVGSFYTNGVALPIGIYNSGNLPGFIIGSGNLQVASGISTGLWTGLGANNNWSTGGNWDNNAVPIFPHALTFIGNSQLNNNNDLSGITVASFTFDAAAGAFTIGGSDISLSSGISFNGNPSAPVTQTINLNMAWSADKTLDTPTNGNLTLGGNINASANNLTKIDAGTLTLGGSSDSFAGYIGNGGTTVITGNVAINGTGGNDIYLGANTPYSSTLVIQNGATLNVSGSFGDNMVLGRNGGSGTVIQNGGLFTYFPGNVAYLFIGATSTAGTRAEYDMNGGVLDMSGYTIGVALGDGGVVYTAYLNQTGGSINNVFKLDLGAVRSYGNGVYNLSGGTINIDFGGIVSDSGSYQVNLGGGTIAAIDGWTSSLNMNLTNLNGSVTFNPNGQNITLSGALSGNGGLIVTNSGTLELSGVSSYTGDTIVSAGTTLQWDVSGTGASAIRVVDGATLSLSYSGTRVVPACYTNGVALPNGVYNSGNLSGFISGSGSLQVASAISTGLWTGLGVNNNWSTAGNWDYGAEPVFPIGLTFAGNNQLVNNNDLSGITASSITFDAAAGAFVLNGNDISLSGTISFNGTPAAPVTQTVNLNMAWSADKTFNMPTNGNLTLGGNLTSGNNVSKTGAGTLTLGGTVAIENLDVNGGTNIITGHVAVNGNGVGYDRFYVGDGDSIANCNGTLIIQPGATLAVTGSFNDAAVIGRDSGSGTIIQNGGTFVFNPANNQLFLLAASGNSATRAEYHMNGGLWDMSNYKLGVGLGNVGGITGAVYQASGVITNVGDLDIGTLTANGYGEYDLTGGSIYIGSGGITTFNNHYGVNLGGGTVAASTNWSSSLNLNLTGNNGSVTFDTATNKIILSGALTGTGGLTKISSGTLELSGVNNAYTGDTTVSAGVLQLDAAGNSSSAIRIVNGATLNLTYGSTLTVPALYTNGVALAGGVYNSANLPGFITGTGSLTVAAAAPPVVNHTVISGGNLILTGSGGTAGAGYTWLTTTNLAAPIIWTTNTTGTFDSNGNFSNAIPVSVVTPAKFFRLRTP